MACHTTAKGFVYSSSHTSQASIIFLPRIQLAQEQCIWKDITYIKICKCSSWDLNDRLDIFLLAAYRYMYLFPSCTLNHHLYLFSPILSSGFFIYSHTGSGNIIRGKTHFVLIICCNCVELHIFFKQNVWAMQRPSWGPYNDGHLHSAN